MDTKVVQGPEGCTFPVAEKDCPRTPRKRAMRPEFYCPAPVANDIGLWNRSPLLWSLWSCVRPLTKRAPRKRHPRAKPGGSLRFGDAVDGGGPAHQAGPYGSCCKVVRRGGALSPPASRTPVLSLPYGGEEGFSPDMTSAWTGANPSVSLRLTAPLRRGASFLAGDAGLLSGLSITWYRTTLQ